MSKRVLILHGWGGSDFPHWQSHLACEVAKNYGCVSFPALPNPEFPLLLEWKSYLKEELASFKPDIVVCHSLANILWFHLCHDGDIESVEKLYLVAPPRIDCDIPEIASFFGITFPQKLYAKETLLITSTNDPYLDPKEADAMHQALNVKRMVIEEGGHINTQSGFGPWEWMNNEVLSGCRA